MKKIGRSLLIFLLLSACALADVQITARVDRNSVAINETFSLYLQVNGDTNIGNLGIPELPDFEKLGQSQSTQIQLINGRMNRSQTIEFTLRALKQGNLQIPALRFSYQGSEYQTEAIPMTVTAPNTQPQTTTAPPPPNITDPFDLFRDQFFNQAFRRQAPTEMDLRVEILPGRTQVYEGEKFAVTVRILYDRGFVQNPQITLPDFSGFAAQGASNQFEHGESDRDGKHFYTETLVRSLSALKPGNFTIGSVTLVYRDSAFGGGKEQRSKPVAIKVWALPEPRPKDFSGAVGIFKLSLAKPLPKLLKSFEPAPLDFVVSGAGALDRVQNLSMTEIPGLRFYLDKTEAEETLATNRFNSRKTFHYFVIPEKSGPLPAAEIQLTYFDPAQKRYQSQALTLTLPPAQTSLASQTLTASNTVSAPSDSIQIHIPPQQALAVKKYGKLVLLIAGVMGLGTLVLQVVQKFRRRRVRLIKKQLSRLNSLPDKAEWAKEAYEVLMAIAQHRFHTNIRGITHESLRSEAAGIPIEQLQNIVEILGKLEELRFAPNPAITNELKKDITGTLHGLLRQV